MRTLRTILPLILLAAFLPAATSHALPSCCQSGDSGNTSSVGSSWTGVRSALSAPSAPETVRSYRPQLRQAAAPAQPITRTTPAKARTYAKPAPVQRAAAPSLPSCCAAGGTGYRQSAGRYPSAYGQVKPQATPGAIASYGGCCGAPVNSGRPTAANPPSCCSTGGSSSAGYRGTPAPASNVPSCCSTSGGSSSAGYRAEPAPSPSSALPPCCQTQGGAGTGYKGISARQNAQPVRAVPASASRRSGNGYYWNTVAGSGAFSQPGYFPAVRSMW